MVSFIVACAAAMVGHTAQATETTTYVLTDAQGTVLAREDAHGTTIATYDYRPYGKQQTGPATAGPGYTGHVDDPDTGLVYMQARYYDPLNGRFLGVDPMAPVAGDIYSFNRYSYVNNNPVNHIDPSGKCVEDACIGEAIAACIAYAPCAVTVAAGASIVAIKTVQAVNATVAYVRQHTASNSQSANPSDKYYGDNAKEKKRRVNTDRKNHPDATPEGDWKDITGGQDTVDEDGNRIGPNGERYRDTENGPRIDIPADASGNSKHETIHYPPPPPPPPPPEPKEVSGG